MEQTAISECMEIARKIDAPIDEMVREVILSSNQNKILYHGVKSPKSIEQIEKHGLNPITPEGGNCSYWATGMALFEPDMDSPFFNYSGQYSIEHPDIVDLSIVMTDYNSLKDRGIRLSPCAPDDQILVFDTIPPEELTIVKVKIDYSNDHTCVEPRMRRQRAEKELLRLIRAHIMNDYENIPQAEVPI
jgi:hypothetical protein